MTYSALTYSAFTKHRLICASCMLVLLLFSDFTSAQETTLFWRSEHRPPASILHGPDQGQGFIDKIRDSLIAELPQYRHELMAGPLDSIFNEMAHGKPVCNPLLFVTQERKQYAYFSIPASITPAMRIVMTKKLADSLQLTEPVSLEALLGKKRTFATITARSYGPFIDKTLREKSNKYMHAKMKVDTAIRLFKLLEKQRVDFTFAYPFELNYYLTIDASTEFKMFTIEDTDDYTLGSVGCSKTPLGKQIIKQVNAILKRQRTERNAIEIMNEWWPEESDKPAFKSFYENVYLKNNETSIK